MEEKSKKTTPIIIVVIIILVVAAGAVYYFTLEPDYTTYESLKAEHTEQATAIDTKANELVTVSNSADTDIDAIQDKSDELATEIQAIVDIDTKLIAETKKLNLDEETTLYTKRKEAEEALVTFYDKGMGCVDLAFEGKTDEFEVCDQESADLFTTFEEITEEFQELEATTEIYNANTE